MDQVLSKRDLAREIAQDQGLSPKDAEGMVALLFKHLAETLRGGTKINVRGFGTFEPRFRPPREARDPRNGQKVQVGKRMSVSFRPSRTLRVLDPPDGPEDNRQLSLFGG